MITSSWAWESGGASESMEMVPSEMHPGAPELDPDPDFLHDIIKVRQIGRRAAIFNPIFMRFGAFHG